MGVSGVGWIYYWGSVLLLTGLLVFPVGRMIWVLSVRRLERKRGHTLSDVEQLGQRRRALFIALVLCATFSALFNYQLLGMGDLG
ncbi:MAG: hypothetical protein ACFB6S_07450 [Geminicoccaceae bacterium]